MVLFFNLQLNGVETVPVQINEGRLLKFKTTFEIIPTEILFFPTFTNPTHVFQNHPLF
jgi:hypothetical protein